MLKNVNHVAVIVPCIPIILTYFLGKHLTARTEEIIINFISTPTMQHNNFTCTLSTVGFGGAKKNAAKQYFAGSIFSR